MLKYRLLSGIFMGLMVLGAIFIDGVTGRILFLIIGGFLAYCAVNEYLYMLEKIGLKSFPVIASSIAAATLFFAVLNLWMISILIVIFSVIAGWFILIIAEDKKTAIIKIISSFSAFPLLVLPLCFLVLLYMENVNGVSGRLNLFFLLLITKFGDIGAYTVGTITAKKMPNGNHKILPKISPQKSWEGTIGGMIISVIIAAFFCYYVSGIAPVGVGKIIFPLLTGVLLFIGGFVGDLAESSLKRTAGVKDSGNIIPGMGGALDVIDSLILNAPLFYFFLILTA